MAGSSTLSSAADRAGLGGGAVGNVPGVAQSSGLITNIAVAADGAGVGGVALLSAGGSSHNSLVVVAVGLALGSTTDRAGLGSGAGSIGPDVSTLGGDLHGGAGDGDGDVVVALVEDIVGSNIQSDSQAALGTLVDGALEAHNQSFSSHIGGGVGSTDEEHGLLGKAGFTEVQFIFPGPINSSAALNIGQALGDHNSETEAGQVVDGGNVDVKVNSITGFHGGGLGGHGEFHTGANRGNDGLGATDGNGSAGSGEGEIIVIAVKHITNIHNEISGQSAGSALIDGALEAHNLGFTEDVGGIVGGTDEDHGLLGKAGFTKVQLSLPGFIDAGALRNEGQTLGNNQLKSKACQVLHRADGDGVGDGITHVCRGLVGCHREFDGVGCRYRYCSNHQAHEQGKTQDNRCNSLVHDQAPFLCRKAGFDTHHAQPRCAPAGTLPSIFLNRCECIQ